MKTKYLKNLAGTIILVTLASCGGIGSCPPDGNNANLTLKIEAPTQYPAGVAVTAYLTMTNTSNVNGTNLVYTVPNSTNYTGVEITTDPNGAGQNCANIAVGASCTFTASIPVGSKPGSFTVLATPNGASVQSSKSSTSAKSLQAGGSISVTANLGLVNTPNFITPYYILPSEQVVNAESGVATTVYVSVWLKTVGDGLNSLNLVDETGTALTYSSVGTPSYTANSVNTYKLTIPAGITLQNIRAKSNVCSADCSNNATINLTASGTGILAIQPNYFQMTESYTTQVVTLRNTGSGAITQLTLPTISAPFSVESNICNSDLAINASCTLSIKYTVGANSDESRLTVNYNNGTQTADTTITIPYVGAIFTLAPRVATNLTPMTFTNYSGSAVTIDSITTNNPSVTVAPNGDQCQCYSR